MDKDSSRFLAVNLSEAEWQALREVTPDPCGWIKTQIQRLLDESGVTPAHAHEEQDHLFPHALAD
jgi:hypothetical protein